MTTRFPISLLALGLMLATSSAAQPVAEPPVVQPATLPASQPTTAETNPLLSPASMMQYFRTAVAEGRLEDAARCLNFAQVDEDVRRARAGEYVTQVAEILRQLEATGFFDPRRLPDEPTAPPQSIGKDPILLVLERTTRELEPAPPPAKPDAAATPEPAAPRRALREWQFSASTVAAIPTLFAKLPTLTELQATEHAVRTEQPATEVAPDESDPLRSPYHMVQYFLVKAADAEKNAAAYLDAMRCLDLSTVHTTAGEFERGPEYVDGLAAVIAALRADGDFDRESLPKTRADDLDTIVFGSDPLLAIVVRQEQSRWRFSATTVERVPEMVRALKAREAGPAAAPPTMALDTSSPQATLNLYLTAMNAGDIATAVRCLDLSQLGAAQRELAGVLAGKLWLVLNRHQVIVLQDVPRDPNGVEPYALLKHPAGRIELDRQRSGERTGEWLFTAATVRSIEPLYEKFQNRPILHDLRDARISFWQFPSLYVREYVVPAALKRPLWGLQAWQWLGVALGLLVGVLVLGVFRFGVQRASAARLEAGSEADRLTQAALRPTAVLIMIGAWWASFQLLDLGATVMAWIWRGLRILLIVFAVLAFYRAIDIFVAYVADRATRSAGRLDDVLIPLIQKTLKVVTIIAGFLLVAQAFGFAITPLLAGLGVGGLAFGLAAQDTLKNFFGSVNVVLDRPFQVGDWVIIGQTEGTVESVGLRSSRIRTFYNSQVTIPNSELANARIDNMGRRRYRRTLVNLPLRYGTPPDQLERFCEGIRELIRSHPFTRKDFYQVAVNNLGVSAIEIQVICFHECADSIVEARERQRLFLDLLRLADQLNIIFAYPTQTVHVVNDDAASAQLAKPP